MIKRNLSILLCLVITLGAALVIGTSNVKAAPSFAYGADIGWLKQLEDEGVTWLNDNGEQEDPLQILKSHGINSVRLRVFVNPSSNYYWLKDETYWIMLGYSDKAGVLEAAQRAKNMGMRIMVDFHYSDVFADPGTQIKPTDWGGYSFSQLKTVVYDHTYDVMRSLANVGVYPEWVQVGNEMNPGIIHPEGSSDNFSQLTQLLNSGYDAVKAVSSSSKVVSHLAHGTDNAGARWFFDNFITTYGGKTDVIGFSFYPYWKGEPYWELTDALAYNLNDMASRYAKEVMIVEVGGDENNPTDTYWTINNTIDLVKAVPDGKGLGVFYWEPEANSSVISGEYPLGATSQVSTNVLQFTTAIDAFTDSQANNLINNSSFETGDLSDWNVWTDSGNSDAVYVETNGNSGAYRATHWKSTAYQASIYQTLTGLENGAYTLKAWVKNSGGQNTCQIYAKNFGGSELNTDLPVTNTWTQVTIENIYITNNSIEVGVWSDANAGNWINIDDVELIKTKDR